MDRIAWSRSGFVAYISGGKVYITWLHCEDGERWTFVPPVNVPVSSDSEPCHMMWSTSNYDLAIVDAMGRIQISTISSEAQITNHIVASLASDSRPRPTELDAVVGTYWLGLEKNLIIPSGFGENDAKDTKAWESVPQLGPFHPIKGRGALVCVNGNGMLRLLVQTPDQHYTEVDAVMPGAECVTNVAFVANGASLLVAVHCSTKGIIVYDTTLTWFVDNMVPPANKQECVKISVVPIASTQLISTSRPSLTALTLHRSIGPGGARGDLELRAVFPSVTAVSSPSANSLPVKSVIQRFAIKTRLEHIHSAFFELLTATNPAPPSPQTEYKVVSLGEEEQNEIRSVLVSELIISTLYVDGAVKTESLVPSNRVDLGNCGLNFIATELSGAKHICLSPNSTCVATLTDSDSSKPTLLTIHNSDENTSMEAVSLIASSLATRYAYTVFNSVQCDDMLGICWSLLYRELPKSKDNALQSQFFNIIDSEAQRLLNVNFTSPSEPRQVDGLIVIPSPLQRWLSFTMVLGTTKGWNRSPGCLVCLGLLNMQLLAFSLTWTMKKISQRTQAQTPEQFRSELAGHCFHISNMLGLLRWLTDLSSRICQEVYQSSAMETNALVGQPNVFTSFLFSGISRFLFKFAFRSVRSLTQTMSTLAQNEKRVGGDIVARTQSRFTAIIKSSPVALEQFDAFLAEVDDRITKHLQPHRSGNDGKPDRLLQSIDAELLKSAKCPDILSPVAPQIIKAFKSHIQGDFSVLYYYDTAWLQLDGKSASAFSVGGTSEDVDIIRKKVILPTDIKQKCTRCGMLSSVEYPKIHGIAQWTLLFQRYCLCGGSWLTQASALPNGPKKLGDAVNGSRIVA